MRVGLANRTAHEEEAARELGPAKNDFLEQIEARLIADLDVRDDRYVQATDRG